MRVIAIEPNGDMRGAADSYPLVEFREATAEATGLQDASVDLITCFQSFHWFNPDTCLREFHRILRPSGRLALVWNVRDKRDSFTNDYTNVVRRGSDNDPAVDRANALDPLAKNQYFAVVDRHTFPYRQSLNLEGLIGRALSSSYVPREGPMYARIMLDLEGLHEKHGDELGMVHLAYVTEVHLAKPSP
jgi:SAM-dependent methyltransferase